jgi:hypothetical protein
MANPLSAWFSIAMTRPPSRMYSFEGDVGSIVWASTVGAKEMTKNTAKASKARSIDALLGRPTENLVAIIVTRFPS